MHDNVLPVAQVLVISGRVQDTLALLVLQDVHVLAVDAQAPHTPLSPVHKVLSVQCSILQ